MGGQWLLLLSLVLGVSSSLPSAGKLLAVHQAAREGEEKRPGESAKAKIGFLDIFVYSFGIINTLLDGY